MLARPGAIGRVCVREAALAERAVRRAATQRVHIDANTKQVGMAPPGVELGSRDTDCTTRLVVLG